MITPRRYSFIGLFTFKVVSYCFFSASASGSESLCFPSHSNWFLRHSTWGHIYHDSPVMIQQIQSATANLLSKDVLSDVLNFIGYDDW